MLPSTIASSDFDLPLPEPSQPSPANTGVVEMQSLKGWGRGRASASNESAPPINVTVRSRFLQSLTQPDPADVWSRVNS